MALILSDQLLCKRFEEICRDTRISEQSKLHFLSELVKNCIDLVDCAALLKLGSTSGLERS